MIAHSCIGKKYQNKQSKLLLMSYSLLDNDDSNSELQKLLKKSKSCLFIWSVKMAEIVCFGYLRIRYHYSGHEKSTSPITLTSSFRCRTSELFVIWYRFDFHFLTTPYDVIRMTRMFACPDFYLTGQISYRRFACSTVQHEDLVSNSGFGC